MFTDIIDILIAIGFGPILGVIILVLIIFDNSNHEAIHK